MIVHPLTETASKIQLDRSFGLSLKSDEVSKVPEIFFDFKNRLLWLVVALVFFSKKLFRKVI
jgi:hypothetical protein